MKILVTGGAGFIGSHLTEYLLKRGDFVVVLDSFNDFYDPSIKKSNLSIAAASRSFCLVEGDILNVELLNTLFKKDKFDVIVHLAARAGVRPSIEQPLLYEEVNCRGTLNLLECAKKYEVKRFVFASSSSVYGNVKEVPFREDARIDSPASPYAATKAAGELYCRNYHNLYGISVNVLRFFTVYGPRQRPDMAIHKFVRLINSGKPVPFFGDGNTARDYTYFEDIIRGIASAIDCDFGFEIFNLGESRTTTLASLVEIIERALGKKAILQKLPSQKGDVEITYADVTKAKKMLSYRPSTLVEDGIREFVKWFRTINSTR